MIHVTEMSWAKKVRKPGDLLKPGDIVEAVILSIQLPERRIALGLKQAIGDPWADAAEKFPIGSIIEGPITSFTKFGAFVQLAEGIEGMIHVSEISAEKRIERPQDVLRAGQIVKAKILDLDKEKRQLRLSIKQSAPTGLDEFIAEHKTGDIITGRLIEISGNRATVAFGEGVQARCTLPDAAPAAAEPASTGQIDLSALSSMLKAKWKSGPATESKPEAIRAGQTRSFRITTLNPDTKAIEVQPA